MKAHVNLRRHDALGRCVTQLGVTLIELLIAIIILAIALATLVNLLTQGINRSADPLWERHALTLAQAYGDEILSMGFDGSQALGGGAVAGPCVVSSDGQTRPNFNDVDDYNNLVDAPPVLIDSTLDMSVYQRFEVEVSVSCDGTRVGLSNDNSAKRIDISVETNTGAVRTVSFYKGNF